MHITLICADDDTWALGMRSISAALKGAGHQTRMIFGGSTRAPFDASTVGKIVAMAAESDIIGISSMSRASKRAKILLEGLESLKKVTVWGGMHPTLYPEDCTPHADLICRGEGEGFMIELAERIAGGKGFGDILNGGFQRNGHIELNELRPLINNLDSLEFPDFSFGKEYILNGGGELQPNSGMREASSVLFSGSRGCLYSCHYCSNSQLIAMYRGKGLYARKMSVEKSVASAKECRELFPQAKFIYFTDEDFFARPVDDVRKFTETYPTKVGLPFECMASPLQITEEKMDLMVRAGMWRVDVGVESGSDRVKRHIFNRPADNEAVMRAASIISRHPQVVAYYFFIIGNPYEERADLRETIGLLKRMPVPFFLRAYSLVFLPGTRLFERARRDGIIEGLEDSGYEIDFVAGLDYRGPEWKKKNLYLNSLIALMAGKFTRFRMGPLPRWLVPALTAPRVVGFCDRHIGIGKTAVRLSKAGLKLRRAGLALISRALKNQKIAYGLKFLRKNGGGRGPGSTGS